MEEKIQPRKDDYQQKRAHLKNKSDEELYNYFWELAEKLVDPLVETAKTHTSPSIERSVLLRMGFSSIEAEGIVKKILEKNLLGKGAGGVVYRMSKKIGKSVRETGLAILNGEEIVI